MLLSDSKAILPLVTMEIQDKIVSSNKTLRQLAQEYNIDSNGILEEEFNYADKKLFGLTPFEKDFVIAILRMTRLRAEDLYDSLKQYIPSLTLGNLKDCELLVKINKKRQTL